MQKLITPTKYSHYVCIVDSRVTLGSIIRTDMLLSISCSMALSGCGNSSNSSSSDNNSMPSQTPACQVGRSWPRAPVSTLPGIAA